MSQHQKSPSSRKNLVVFLPLALFGALALLFLVRLYSGDPQKLPSALVGKRAPATELTALPGLVNGSTVVPGLKAQDFRGEVTVLNIFASWCVPCRDEHPSLMQLAKTGSVRILGLNFKDKPDAALKFLMSLGNPYSAVGVDPAGRAGIEWGVYGVPETFVIRADGTIAFKHVGPLSAETLQSVLLPQIEKARKN